MSEQPPASGTRETVVVDQGAGGLNPLYVALGIVLALAALALLWIFVIDPLILADDPEPDPVAVETTPTPAPETPEATPSPVPEEELDPDEVPVETVEVFLARDPFRPIRPDEPAADGTAPGDPDAPDGDDDVTDGEDTDGDVPPEELPPTDGEEREDRAQLEGKEVTLIDVFTDDDRAQAVVQVDDEQYTVGVGEPFDDGYVLREIDPGEGCVRVARGDSDGVRLCEGQRVLK